MLKSGLEGGFRIEESEIDGDAEPYGLERAKNWSDRVQLDGRRIQ